MGASIGLCGTTTPIFRDMGITATHKDMYSQVSYETTHLSANSDFWAGRVEGCLNFALWASWVLFKASKATSQRGPQKMKHSVFVYRM